jgi:hypothetical protein
MVRYRSHSIEFKRQIAQEFLAGETLHGLANDTKRAPSTRTLPRPTSFSNMKRGSRPSNGWSASKRWNWSF